jgi:hypothetical protein
MASDAQIKANQANAQKSTGPISEAGKAKSSHNAVKTGLTGHTIVLPTDDVAAYERHIDRFFNDYDPADDEERTLVQWIADTEWRLLRIASLESGIYAIGRRALAAELTDEQDPAVRAALIEAQIFVNYRKDLSNLALQEARLSRQRDARMAELKGLQDGRKERFRRDMQQAADQWECAKKLDVPYDPAQFGFEFTIGDVERHLDVIYAKNFLRGEGRRFTEEGYRAVMSRGKDEEAA